MCLTSISFKLLSWEVSGSKPRSLVIQNLIVEIFDSIKKFAQIWNNFSRVWQKKNNNLIYAKMIKVLQYVVRQP